MADEYSDEEFAPDDAEPTYEAEFDDAEDDELADAAYETDEEDAVTAYQESYDVVFDPPDMEETTTTTMAVAPHFPVDSAEEADTHKPEHLVEATELRPAKTASSSSATDRDEGFHDSRFPTVPERTLRVPKPVVSDRTAPVRRSSEPRVMAVAVPEIERHADPELQMKLIRRSSSPRDRPAPIARLSSVGELRAAAPEELVVPTNSVTEEAAAVVGAGANDVLSAGLVKRHSSQSFVPRLPSLRELSYDLSALEAGRTNGSGDDEDDDQEEENEEEGDDDEDEVHDSEVVIRRADTVTEQGIESPISINEGDVSAHGEDGLYSESDKTEPRISAQAADASERPLYSSMDSRKRDDVPSKTTDLQSHNLSCADAMDDVQPERTASADVPDERDINDAGERTTGVTSVAIDNGESQAHSSNESSTSQLSEHLPGDEDVHSDHLQHVMAEVASQEALEDQNGIAEDLDDDAERDVDADDESRRETQHLLQDAQILISQHKPATPLTEVPVNNIQSISGAGSINATDRYGDDDQFSDNAYDDEDQELVDGAYYDSDHENIVDEEHASSAPPQRVVTSIQATDPSTGEKSIRHDISNVSSPESTTTLSSARLENVKQPVIPSRTLQQSTASNRQKSNVVGEKPRAYSQGSVRPPVRQGDVSRTASVSKPDVPKLTPKAPVPRQNGATPRQSCRTAVGSSTCVSTTGSGSEKEHSEGADRVAQSRLSPSRESRVKAASPVKSDHGQSRPGSPARAEIQDTPSSPPRKAPVFKQNRPPNPQNPEGARKKLKPVKCPPNLRIDLPHVDKEKREWLLLNMFRHGDNISKFEPFIPTTTPQQAVELHLPGDALKRPLSASGMHGEVNEVPRRSTSRGAYGRHSGRKIVNQPVDPRTREREQNWISSTPSVSVIPPYDSILDKYCKTVTSPVVQRRIYETRMDDLSPQLAMVLEKRAFREWKHCESDGFCAATNSYRSAIVLTKNAVRSSMKELPTPRPPSASGVRTHASLGNDN